jgi:hypothetical protein
MPTAEKEADGHACSEKIGRLPRTLPLQLLGCHIDVGAHARRVLSNGCLIDCFGQAKIEYYGFCPVPHAKRDIGRLDISVDGSRSMHGLEAFEQPAQEQLCLSEIWPSSVVNTPLDVSAFHILEHKCGAFLSAKRDRARLKKTNDMGTAHSLKPIDFAIDSRLWIAIDTDQFDCPISDPPGIAEGSTAQELIRCFPERHSHFTSRVAGIGHAYGLPS